MRAELYIRTLAALFVSGSLPAVAEPLQRVMIQKPINAAGKLYHGLFSAASTVDFFTAVQHEPTEAEEMSDRQQVAFFTDRPIKNDPNGQVARFLPGSLLKNCNEITMGKVLISNATVLPTGIAAPVELKDRSDATRMEIESAYADRAKFLTEVEQICKESICKKICIFIPGFSMTFDQSLASAAALQKYSNIPVILYSWPSQDSPFVWNYYLDQTSNERSMSLNGKAMIDAIVDRLGAENIILVGFSQGAKLAIQYAANRQSAESNNKPDRFFAQVFARADQPRAEFQKNMAAILSNAQTSALFVSSKDRLLLFSGHFLHRRLLSPNTRTGAAACSDFVIPDGLEDSFEVIDDTTCNNKITNHTFNARGIANWLIDCTKTD